MPSFERSPTELRQLSMCTMNLNVQYSMLDMFFLISRRQADSVLFLDSRQSRTSKLGGNLPTVFTEFVSVRFRHKRLHRLLVPMLSIATLSVHIDVETVGECASVRMINKIYFPGT